DRVLLCLEVALAQIATPETAVDEAAAPGVHCGQAGRVDADRSCTGEAEQPVTVLAVVGDVGSLTKIAQICRDPGQFCLGEVEDERGLGPLDRGGMLDQLGDRVSLQRRRL